MTSRYIALQKECEVSVGAAAINLATPSSRVATLDNDQMIMQGVRFLGKCAPTRVGDFTTIHSGKKYCKIHR